MKEQIQSFLHTECPWRDTLYWYPTIDSTNTQAKLLAAQDAPHGTVLVAGSQTQGRGRLGRSFHSPAGMGIYLSVILRPGCKPEQLMHLTCSAAVAACKAVHQICGLTPDIKWINDLVRNGKKLGGILTELSCDRRSGLVDFAVIGIGINCNQAQTDFTPDIQNVATSLQMETGKEVSRAALAAALIENLAQMSDSLLSRKDELMAFYRQHCITIGKDIQVIRNGNVRPGKAIDMDEDGALLVAFADGSKSYVNSGEVSIRGMYGYV